jgi:hypothetical protein
MTHTIGKNGSYNSRLWDHIQGTKTELVSTEERTNKKETRNKYRQAIKPPSDIKSLSAWITNWEIAERAAFFPAFFPIFRAPIATQRAQDPPPNTG